MKKVDWTKWSGIAEMLSSLAILATLIFLVLETQQNTRAIEAAASQGVADAESNVLNQLLNFPEIGLSLAKDELTNEEVVRLGVFLSLMLRAHEQRWGLYKLGAIDEITLGQYEQSLAGMLSLPLSRAWWEAGRDDWGDPEFASRVDQLLRDTPITTNIRPQWAR